jgi:hypothetical protein
MKTATVHVYTEPSLAKQAVLLRYAKGEITRQQLAEEIASVQPPDPHLSWRYRLAAMILTTIATAFIPPIARRQD